MASPSSPPATPMPPGTILDRQACSEHILADLPRLRELAAQFALARSRWKTLMIVCIIAVIPAIFATVALPLLFPVPVLALAGAILFGVLMSRTPVYDRRQLDVAEQVVRLLAADSAAEAPLRFRLDMRPHALPEKLVGESTTATGWDAKHYISPWLTVTGRLLDGTHFDVRLITRFQARKKWKRSRSGKNKLKHKTKESLQVHVGLRIKPAKYTHLASIAPDARNAMKLPPAVRLHRFRIADDSLEATADAGQWTATPGKDESSIHATQVVAMLLLSLYQILNLSRAIDKQGRAA